MQYLKCTGYSSGASWKMSCLLISSTVLSEHERKKIIREKLRSELFLLTLFVKFLCIQRKVIEYIVVCCATKADGNRSEQRDEEDGAAGGREGNDYCHEISHRNCVTVNCTRGNYFQIALKTCVLRFRILHINRSFYRAVLPVDSVFLFR